MAFGQRLINSFAARRRNVRNRAANNERKAVIALRSRAQKIKPGQQRALALAEQVEQKQGNVIRKLQNTKGKAATKIAKAWKERAAARAALISHPLPPDENVNIGSFFESAEAEQNKKNERKKYEKMIRNGATISKSNRNKIELLYNNLAKELNKRNSANKKAALLAAKRKANANTLEKRRIAVELASEQEKSTNRASREERNKAVKNAKTAANKEADETEGNMAAFAQEFQKKPSILNRGKAFLAARASKKPLPPSFNEAAARNALRKYLNASVKPTYNKALVNAILKLQDLNNNTRRRLQSPRMYALQRGAGALGRGAVVAGKALGRGAVTAGGALGRGAVAAGGALGSGAVVAGKALGSGARGAVAYLMKPRIEKLKEIINNPRTRRGERENAIRELYAISKDLRTRISNKTNAETFLGTLGNLNSIVKGQKAPGLVSRIFGRSSNNLNFLPVEYIRNNNGNYIINSDGKKKAAPPPLGYVLKSYYNKNGKQTTGYFKIKNSKTLQSQLEYMSNGPRPRPTGYYGPRRNNYGNRYGPRYNNYYGYGPRRNNRGVPGPIAPSGGIVFAPKINVGAARIGAQTFGGTRVGGQQMGGSRVRTGNTGSTTLKTGNTGVGTQPANTGLTVSAPTSNGSRQLAATPEQLIRGAGGAEAVEQGIKALNAAKGNVIQAKAMSRLSNNTFTNIYAMGGPIAAKRLVEKRRRRRTVGGASKKKHVVHKPKKQYIKLTPYQFRRLTDHIKKNNLRKVLIKEITH